MHETPTLSISKPAQSASAVTAPAGALHCTQGACRSEVYCLFECVNLATDWSNLHHFVPKDHGKSLDRIRPCTITPAMLTDYLYKPACHFRCSGASNLYNRRKLWITAVQLLHARPQNMEDENHHGLGRTRARRVVPH